MKMHPNIKDITGQRFSRLTVLAWAPRPAGVSGRDAFWRVRCDCGAERVLRGADFKTGEVKSCGCLRAEWDANRPAGNRSLECAA